MTPASNTSTSLAALASALCAGEWVDLTPTIENGMPRWPAHPPVIVHPTVTHEHDGYFNQTIFLGEHSGAHVDAPAHSHPGMRTIDSFPPDFLIGPAKVVHWEDRDWQPGELATAGELLDWEARTGCELGAGDIVLVSFGWLRKHWRTDAGWRWYAENMPGMGEDVADLLLDRLRRSCHRGTCGRTPASRLLAAREAAFVGGSAARVSRESRSAPERVPLCRVAASDQERVRLACPCRRLHTGDIAVTQA